MTALDWILALIGLAGFGAFLLVIALWVPQTDLIVVMSVAYAMAVFDLLIRPAIRRRL